MVLEEAAAIGQSATHGRHVDMAQTNSRTHTSSSSTVGRGGSESDMEKKGGEATSTELEHVNTAVTVESRQLYRDGELVLIPAPSRDPRDPLNMPMWKKLIALFFLCFFGAMAAAAELILGALLPVFALVYAHVDPKPFFNELNKIHGLPKGVNSLKTLEMLPGAPPIWKVYLLASLPVLMIGVSNLFMIPLAISMGRRSVILGCGVVAIAGAIWAGFSQSLGSHLGARVVQALGAGTVESLIPFIIQDMVYVHQRNTFISGVFAAQGVIIISLGIATPYMILTLSWRYVYFITAGSAAFFLVGVFLFMPETRWHRSTAEMNGFPRRETQAEFEPRTWKHDMALMHGPFMWRAGIEAFWDTLRTFFYPHILFITMLNSAMIATAFAAGYTVSPALLTKPWSWKFQYLGLCLVPVLIAAVLVGVITGHCADWLANWAAKRRGSRVPENQLLNLIFPTLCALVGSILFGISGNDPERFSWALFLFALGLAAFGFLGANTIGAVYVLESFPHLAGPALVNIASFRCLIAFILSFRVSEWVADWGYLKSMAIYTGIMGFFALLIPVVYFWGPSWRARLEAKETRIQEQRHARDALLTRAAGQQ